MSDLLLLLGLISIVALPIFAHLFFYDKIQKKDNQKILSFLSLIPGIILMCGASFLSPTQTPIKSVECGVVKQYKTYKIRHRSTFERLAVVMEIHLVIFATLILMKLYLVYKANNMSALSSMIVLKIKD